MEPITLNQDGKTDRTLESIECISNLCKNTQIRWFCVPFKVFGQDGTMANDCAVRIADKYKNAFINYIVTNNNRVDRKAVLCASHFVKLVSKLSQNGFDNFRCGVSFNCKPNGAFFPFTHHEGKTGFSVSLEVVPVFIDIIKTSKEESLEQTRSKIINQIVPVLKRVNDICLRISESTGMTYYGIDASLAPHPEEREHSVAFLVELLGVEQFGASGTSFVTSYLTDIIRSLISQSDIKVTGFNGVMYSVLEDPGLGEVDNKGQGFSIDSLLAFSTMCGCGIDMFPVPGDISEQGIASIMLDISAVANRLNKPLGVRLLPIPGKSAGEFTEFDHDFLHNIKIQRSRNTGCKSRMFEADEPFAYLS